jgi:Uma2 family endonuclease
MGVRYVWVLDPSTKRTFCYRPGQMHELLDGVLRANDPDAAVPLGEVFEP